MPSLIKNISSYSGAVILQKVIAFFYFTVIARALGPEGSGGYFLGLSLAQLFATFADLGVVNYLIREISQDRAHMQGTFGEFLGLRGMVNILAYGGVVLLALLLGYPLFVVGVALLAGVSMVLDSFSAIFFGVLRGHQNLKVESASILIFQSLELVGSIVVLLVSKSVIFLAVALVVASSVHLAIAVHALYRKTFFRISFKISLPEAKSILANSIPFAFIAIFARLYTQADILMLSKINCSVFNCHESVGLYTVGVKATLALQSIPLSFMAAIYPAMSELIVKDIRKVKELFFTTMRFLGILGIAAFVFFQILGREVVTLLWGAAFAPATSVIAILLLGSVFVILSFPCGALLNASKHQRPYAWFIFSALLANVVLNIFFIRWWNFPGAAWASLIGSALLFVLQLLYLVKKFDVALTAVFRVCIPTMLAGALVLASMSLLSGAPWALKGLVSGVLFIAFLFLFRAVSLSDVKQCWMSLRPEKSTAPLEGGGVRP